MNHLQQRNDTIRDIKILLAAASTTTLEATDKERHNWREIRLLAAKMERRLKEN